MKDKFFNRFAVAMLGASLTALPSLVSGIETGTGTNQTANLYATNSITLRGSAITNWQALTNSLDTFYIKNVSNWSYYAAVSNVNLSDKELTNVAAMTLSGDRRTNWPSASGGGTGDVSTWSYYSAVSNVSLANKELTNVAAMTLSGERRTTWPSAGAGGDPTNWSYYAAVSNVSLANKELTNVAAMTLGGERRTNWPSGAIQIISKTADQDVTSSTTLQNDNELYFTMEAGKTYTFEFRLLVSNNSDAGPDWKSAIYCATASSALVLQSGQEPASAAFPQSTTTDVTTPGTLVDDTIVASAIPFSVWIQGIIVDNGSAGTVYLQWAQNTSDTTALTVKKGSYVIVRKVD